MAEAAGVAFGALGILAAIDGALKSFKLIEGTIRGDRNSHHVCLLYERKRQNLRFWADEMGINTPNPAIERLNKPTLEMVKETLVAIEETHMDAMKYLERYSGRYNVSSLSDLAPGSTQLLKLATEARNQPPTHKVRWSLRDRDKFSAVLKILGDHIDSLVSLTSSVSNDMRSELLASRVVSAIQDQNLLTLKTGVSTSNNAAEQGLDQVLAGIKLLQANDTDVVGELDPVSQGSVTFKSPSVLGSSSLPTATYQPPGNQLPIPVWIEWRYIDPNLLPGEPHRQAMRSRIKRLGYLLDKVRNQPIFRASIFVGLYEDLDFDPTTGATRLGFMYSTPLQHGSPGVAGGNLGLSPTISFARPNSDSFPNPLSLREFIATAKSNQIPTLGQRVKLATSLCMTFAMLHSAGWLHKDFSSSVVWFFAPLTNRSRDNKNSPLPELEHPYITGYNSSRPTDHESLQRGEIDHRQYWLHPRAVAKEGGGFTRILDLYSLGIVLLEIGLWCPATARLPKNHPGSLEAIHAYLSTRRVKKLGFQAGMLYQEVVETLLCCDFTEGADDETLTREFFVKVLHRLIKISVD